MVDLSPNGIADLRRETSEFARPGCQAVIEELGTVITEGAVGSVDCLWITPRAVDHSECVLFFFGGGFVTGCPEDDLSITARLAAVLGRRICCPRYRLAPEHPWPAASDDAMSVYCALANDASNNEGIIVVGQSAGGNLALGLLLTLCAQEGAAVQMPIAVALLSPWADLTHSGDSHATLAELDPTLSVKFFLEPAALAYAGGESCASPVISPLLAPDFPDTFPPTVITTGTRDLLLSDATRISKHLRRKGVRVDLQIAEGLWHVFEAYPELPEAEESVRHIAAFIGSCCKISH